MKAILIETTLVSSTILFWAVALPAAVVLLPAVALWEKIGSLIPRGPIGHIRPENSQDPPESRFSKRGATCEPTCAASYSCLELAHVENRQRDDRETRDASQSNDDL
jgi:hypothetical protein